MTEHRVARIGIVALASALVFTGCSAPLAAPTPVPTPTNVDGSSVEITDVERNGIEYLTGQGALDAVLAGMDEAGAVTATGTFQERPDEDGGGGTRRLQVTLTGTETRFRAEVSAADVAVTAVVVDGLAYVTGNARFAAVLGVPEAAGGVVCLAADDPRVTMWAPSLSPAALLESMLSESSGVTLEPATEPAETGDSVEFVVGSAGSPIGSLVVATTGPAVPLRLVAADPRGDADFSFVWGDTPDIEAPAEVTIPCS